MTIYKYIFHKNQLKVTEIEAENLSDGYVLKKGEGFSHIIKSFPYFIKSDAIGKAVGSNSKHVYLLEKDDALAASAFRRYKQRNLEELWKNVKRLKRDIKILEEIGGCKDGADGRMSILSL